MGLEVVEASNRMSVNRGSSHHPATARGRDRSHVLPSASREGVWAGTSMIVFLVMPASRWGPTSRAENGTQGVTVHGLEVREMLGLRTSRNTPAPPASSTCTYSA